MDTAREKFYFRNTMLCLLKAIEGKHTKVEMRDEKEVTGTIVKVDGYMNISMENVVMDTGGRYQKFDQFFVNGKTIRYVHIPDEVNMKQAMERQLHKTDYNKAAAKVSQNIKDAAWQKMKMKERKRKKEEAKANKT